MDNQPVRTEMYNNEQTTNEGFYSPKNVVIMVLSVLLLFSFLGINILDILSNFIKLIIRLFGPIVSELLGLLGYTTGTVINTSADVAADAAKGAIDIAEGTIQNVGDLMIKASKDDINLTSKSSLDNALSMETVNNVDMDISENPIQKPISSNKINWCLVGEYKNKRKCIDVQDGDKCMSGQVFPNLETCLQPPK